MDHTRFDVDANELESDGRENLTRRRRLITELRDKGVTYVAELRRTREVDAGR
jgi:hypothetical protein